PHHAGAAFRGPGDGSRTARLRSRPGTGRGRARRQPLADPHAHHLATAAAEPGICGAACLHLLVRRTGGGAVPGRTQHDAAQEDVRQHPDGDRSHDRRGVGDADLAGRPGDGADRALRSGSQRQRALTERLMADSVFHKDFKPLPWWWEWWQPNNELSQDPPRKSDVLVVGAGYGGLSTALELARSSIDVTVLERGDFGIGASTRNGGGGSGGTTLGKGFSGKGVRSDPARWEKGMERMVADAAQSLTQVETVIAREGIECHWRMSGRFSGAFTPRHYAEQEAKIGTYNESAGLGTYMIPRERQRDEIASDYYYGGMVVERTG